MNKIADEYFARLTRKIFMNILFALPETTNFLLWDISINTQIIDLKELEARLNVIIV